MMQWFKAKQAKEMNPQKYGQCDPKCPMLLHPDIRIHLEQRLYGYEWSRGVHLPGWCKRFQKNLWTRYPDGICWAPRECDNTLDP